MFWPVKNLAVKLWIELCKKEEKYGKKKEEKKRDNIKSREFFKKILAKTKLHKNVRVYGHYLVNKICR